VEQAECLFKTGFLEIPIQHLMEMLQGKQVMNMTLDRLIESLIELLLAEHR
jgi:hypothetical protein